MCTSKLSALYRHVLFLLFFNMVHEQLWIPANTHIQHGDLCALCGVHVKSNVYTRRNLKT